MKVEGRKTSLKCGDVHATKASELAVRPKVAGSSLLYIGNERYLLYVNNAVDPGVTRQAIQEAAAEIGVEDIEIKITPCEVALESIPFKNEGPSDQALVDEVLKELTRNGEGPQTFAAVDLDRPLGKIKGNISKGKAKGK